MTDRKHEIEASRTATRVAVVLGATALGLAPGLALAHTSSVAQAHRTDGRGDQVVDVARAQKGDPYKWAADGPHKFDCSGLTMFAYEKVGVELPHNSQAQYDQVNHIAQSNKRRGDLIFFHDNGDIYHVGIYTGHGKYWSAPRPGEHVKREEIWTKSYYIGRP